MKVTFFNGSVSTTVTTAPQVIAGSVNPALVEALVIDATAPLAVTVDALMARVAALEAGGSTPPTPVVPTFTTQPSLSGSTALGSTITISLGAASGTPAPTLTGTLTRPGKAAVAVGYGDTFQIDAADQGGTITLDVTATNAAGSATASATLEVPAAGPPTVTIPDDGGNKLGTTATVTADGEVTITNSQSALNGDIGVTHYMVRADNMYGKTLIVRRPTGNPNTDGGKLSVWQMAWAYDPHGEWFPFDSVTTANSMVVATKTAPLTQGSVYIARRPVFTNTRWDQAIARWKASPHTSPTASGDANFVVGTLPAITHAPAMAAYGFRFGTGARAVMVTGNVHVDEHIGAYACEAFIDWLLSDDADAAWLRANCTFYVYPKFNPQARYAGASRVEVQTSENANRIWSSQYDNIHLSKIMRDAWKADLPAVIDAVLDWHDYAAGLDGRAATYGNNAADYMAILQARYTARTGSSVIIQKSSTPTLIGGYARGVLGASRAITLEHGTTTVDDVPQWQAWGRDVGLALRDYYATDPAPDPNPWQEPIWVPGDANVAISRATNGDWLITGTDRNPVASIAIPVGKTIEVTFSGDGTGSGAAVYIRQGSGPNLPLATSTDLTPNLGGTKFLETVQVTYDPDKPYVGILKGGMTGTTRTMRMYSDCRYRVLP